MATTVKKFYGNATIWKLGSEKLEIISNGCLIVLNDTIEAVGIESELKSKYSDYQYIDCHGRIIMPGFICAHGHFYGMYARGMDLHDEAPANFVEILERLWWRLDRALDDESNMLSALIFSIAALKYGTTCIVDHHASPSHITNSLDHLAEGTMKAGVRACLAYEVTDRNGLEGAQKGIDENVRFMRKVATENNPMLAATFGLHAPFTCCDDTLKKSVEAVKKISHEFPKMNAGFHVHVAEDKYDEEHSMKNYGKRCLQRLSEFGVLGPNTIIGHGVFLDESEIKLLKESGASLVSNPESNMNNAVGLPEIFKMMNAGVTVGLGTDGMTYDMLQEYRANILAHKLRTHDPRVATMETFQMLFRNNSLITSKYFPKPVGRLDAGSFADFLILNHKTPTMIGAGGLPWHIHFGLHTLDIAEVYVGGRMVVKGGVMQTLDEDKAVAQSVAATPRVWGNMARIVEEDKAAKKH